MILFLNFRLGLKVCECYPHDDGLMTLNLNLYIYINISSLTLVLDELSDKVNMIEVQEHRAQIYSGARVGGAPSN